MKKVEIDSLKAEEIVAEKVARVLKRIAKNEPDTALRVIELIRKEVHFEMSLIGTRITWLLTVQAFLVAGAVLALANALNDRVKYGSVLAILASIIPILGGFICVKTIDAVDRARVTIDLWHTRVKNLYDSVQGSDEPSWLALILGRWTQFNDPFHQESLSLSNILLPRIFAVFWGILLCVSSFLAFKLIHG